MNITLSEIIHHRLINHGLSNSSFTKPEEVVHWLGAVQAQEAPGARWTIAQRLKDAREQDIIQAIETKKIVRTWLFRNTLHFVSAKDLHWMLALSGPVVLARNASQYRKHGLDEKTFQPIAAVIRKILKGGKQLTRKEIFASLEQQKISTQGLRGSYILYMAALNGIICHGPLREKQETYTLLSDWIPETKKITREDALRELALRYFKSHGPATLPDFAWWSGLSMADAKSGLKGAEKKLQQGTFNGQVYWMDRDLPEDKESFSFASLLPAYDEYFVAYKDRSIVLATEFRKAVDPGNGFSPAILMNGTVIGTWRRTLSKNAVTVETKSFTAFSPAQKKAIASETERYGFFLNIKSDYLIKR